MNETQRDLQRIERLTEIRQSYVTAAEAGVREAELYLKYCEDVLEENGRQIRQVREDIAYVNHATAETLQSSERYIFTLISRSRPLRENVEKAKKAVDAKRLEWREAMRERKVVGRVQERRLHEWQRIVDVEEQKNVDEMTVGRYARNQSSRLASPSTEQDSSAAGSERGESR